MALGVAGSGCDPIGPGTSTGADDGSVPEGNDAASGTDTSPLTLYVSGQGSIEVSPGGESCSPSFSPLVLDVPSGSDVTLTAAADDDWTFAIWRVDPATRGEGERVANPLRVMIGGDTQVTAVFAEIEGEFADLEEAMLSTDSDHPPVTQLPALEVPEDMLGLDDAIVRQVRSVVDAINQYQDVAYRGPVPMDDAKAAGRLKWITSCVDAPVPECWHVERDENLTKTLVQRWAHDQYMYRVYYDGLFEGHRYDDFMVESGFVKDDLTHTQHTIYQNPDHPVAPPGPLWEFRFTVTGQDSYLYTPWDLAKSLAVYTYSRTTSIWDSSMEDYRPSLRHVSIRGPYSIVQFQTYVWSYSLSELYLWWESVHTVGHSGRWATYDEHGNRTDSGSW
jgi:hypothetical protein